MNPSITPLIQSSNYSTERYVINSDNVTFPRTAGGPNADPWGIWTQNIQNYQTVQIRNGTNLQCGISFVSNATNQEVLYADVMPNEQVTFNFPVPVGTLRGRFSYLAPTMQLSAPKDLFGVLEIFTSSVVIPQNRVTMMGDRISVPFLYALPTITVFSADVGSLYYSLTAGFTGIVAGGGTPTLTTGPFMKAILIPSATGNTTLKITRGFVANNQNEITLDSGLTTFPVVAGVQYPIGDNIISLKVSLAGITLVAQCDVGVTGMTTQITDP